MVRHWMETGEITYCRRYVDDIKIIFDKNEVTEDSIASYVKNINKYLEFRLTEEENKNINYLDLSIRRGNNHLQLGIYRKPYRQTLLLYTLHPNIH
jgi:hypothetical protein